jgi:hypothetical protein
MVCAARPRSAAYRTPESCRDPQTRRELPGGLSDVAQRRAGVLVGLHAGATNELPRNPLASRLLAGGGGSTDA